MEEEDGLGVCSDGQIRNPCSCLGVDLGKAVPRSDGEESWARLFKNTAEEMGQCFLNSHTGSTVEGFLVINT